MTFLDVFRSKTSKRSAPPSSAVAEAPPITPTPTPPLPRDLFNASAYLAKNPDFAGVVLSGAIGAYEHYVAFGHAEEIAGRRPRSLPSVSPPLGLRYHAEEDLLARVIDLEIEKRALLAAWDSRLPEVKDITLGMTAEEVDDATAPPLDRTTCDETSLSPDQKFWRDNGYLIKEGFIPHDLIDRYCEIRGRHPSKFGWSCPVPYMHLSELRDVSLYPPLMKLMESLIGEEMGLHLNLTGWVSTERNWHQDDYLNPPYINSWYSAAWIALDDISADSGPFEFVPGSHRWPLLKSHKVRMFLTPEERNHTNWSQISERFINGIAEEEISRRGAAPKPFLGKKGDVLIWHGRLMHRGSVARVPDMPRKTLISHYSGLSHRIDMPDIRRTAEGSAYFHLDIPLGFDPYQVAA
jgi:hypothetical protein